MPHVPVRGGLDEHLRAASLERDRGLAVAARAADGEHHVRLVAVEAIDERERHRRVDAADERREQQGLRVAVAALEERLKKKNGTSPAMRESSSPAQKEDDDFFSSMGMPKELTISERLNVTG